MKHALGIIIGLVIISSVMVAQSAHPVCALRLTGQHVTGSDLEFDIVMAQLSSSDTMYLANSDIAVTYNPLFFTGQPVPAIVSSDLTPQYSVAGEVVSSGKYLLSIAPAATATEEERTTLLSLVPKAGALIARVKLSGVSLPAGTSELAFSTVSPYPTLLTYRVPAPVLNDSTVSTILTRETTVSLKVFLQGPYASGSMSNGLRTGGVIPHLHPYGGAPWSYAGMDSVSAVPDSVVDWVLVEVRRDSSAQSKETVRPAFLRTNGAIVDTNGTSPLALSTVAPGSYFVVVRHRNHLAAMTAHAVDLNDNSATYDFTTAMDKAYTHAGNPMVQVGSVYCLYGGNGNGDGAITATDRNGYWRVQNGNTNGYYSGDFNLDRNVTATDRNGFWRPNNGSTSQVP